MPVATPFVRAFSTAVGLLALSACSDQSFANLKSTEPGGADTSDGGEEADADTDTDTDSDTDADTDTDTDTDVDTAVPDEPSIDDPPDDGPPESYIDDCPDEVSVTLDPVEIYVLSHTTTTATAVLTTSSKGWFHVYDTAIAESGSAQQNETGFVRISNASNPGGLPLYPNCASDYIVQDSDNSGPAPGPMEYLGTFWLDEGENTLTLQHVCNLVNAGACSEYMNDVPGQMCGDTGSNSVHVMVEGLCLVTSM